MHTRDAPDTYAFTIFCDDIREEVGGKATYVGVYRGGHMFIHTPFPVTLPKFALAVLYAQKKSVFVQPERLRVYLPGDDDDHPTIEADFPPLSDQLKAKINDSPPSTFDDSSYMAAMPTLIVAPLLIKEPGIVKVRAVQGDELIRLGSLKVHAAPPGATEEVPTAPT